MAGYWEYAPSPHYEYIVDGFVLGWIEYEEDHKQLGELAPWHAIAWGQDDKSICAGYSHSGYFQTEEMAQEKVIQKTSGIPKACRLHLVSRAAEIMGKAVSR